MDPHCFQVSLLMLGNKWKLVYATENLLKQAEWLLYKFKVTGLASQIREEGKDQESIQSNTTPDGKVTKTQEKITNKRARRSALSQQVTTRLQGTDKTA